jgi:hypothetical protein
MEAELDPRSTERERGWRAARRGAEELGRAVLPLVFERVRRLTRELETRARSPGDQSGAVEDAGERVDLRDGAEDVRAAGFLLGVIACARGIDLLLARREEEGLRDVVRWVGVALGARIEPSARELPLLATARGNGWEIPLLGACLFLRAARIGPAAPLALPRARRDERDDRFLADLALLVPGAEALVGDERFGFHWPSTWLAES